MRRKYWDKKDLKKGEKKEEGNQRKKGRNLKRKSPWERISSEAKQFLLKRSSKRGNCGSYNSLLWCSSAHRQIYADII